MGGCGDTVWPRELAYEKAGTVQREESLRGGKGEETEEMLRKLECYEEARKTKRKTKKGKTKQKETIERK